MGCGSSSLKGEKPQDLAGEQPMPNMRRVQTNFSEVNFTGNGNGASRGKSIAVAPDEASRPEPIIEDPIAGDGIVADTKQHHTADGNALAPYKSIEGDSGLASPPAITSAAEPFGSDPTSATSKAAFASTNDPVHEKTFGSEAASSSLALPEAGQKKQAWYDRILDSRSGRNNSQITDEELMRVFGMTREQWNAYVANPKNGVGKNQMASEALPVSGGGVYVGGF